MTVETCPMTMRLACVLRCLITEAQKAAKAAQTVYADDATEAGRLAFDCAVMSEEALTLQSESMQAAGIAHACSPEREPKEVAVPVLMSNRALVAAMAAGLRQCSTDLQPLGREVVQYVESMML